MFSPFEWWRVVGLVIITGYVVRLTTAVGYMGWALGYPWWAVGLVIITGYVVRLTTYVGWAVRLLAAMAI